MGKKSPTLVPSQDMTEAWEEKPTSLYMSTRSQIMNRKETLLPKRLFRREKLLHKITQIRNRWIASKDVEIRLVAKRYYDGKLLALPFR